MNPNILVVTGEQDLVANGICCLFFLGYIGKQPGIFYVIF